MTHLTYLTTEYRCINSPLPSNNSSSNSILGTLNMAGRCLAGLIGRRNKVGRWKIRMPRASTTTPGMARCLSRQWFGRSMVFGFVKLALTLTLR